MTIETKEMNTMKPKQTPNSDQPIARQGETKIIQRKGMRTPHSITFYYEPGLEPFLRLLLTLLGVPGMEHERFEDVVDERIANRQQGAPRD